MMGIYLRQQMSVSEEAKLFADKFASGGPLFVRNVVAHIAQGY
jgi:hypothetical protein